MTELLSVGFFWGGGLYTQVGDKIESGQRQKICSVTEGSPDLDSALGAWSLLCTTACPSDGLLSHG